MMIRFPYKRIALLLIFAACFSFETRAQKKRKVDFSANTIEVNKKISSDAKRLLGNVEFEHEGTFMYCDSAYFYSDSNSLDAFSNVYIKQGDTLHLYSEYAFYNGNTRIAEAKRNVKLIDRDDDGETILYTDELDFDLEKNVGSYYTGGRVINGDNELTSIIGYYFSNDNMYFFRDSVRIYTPDYTIYSDTLKYNTQTKKSFFIGPTEIISEENYIYCENGWYDNENNKARFSENAYLISGSQRLQGDSLYYDRDSAYGEAFQNVQLYDSVEQVIIEGHYGIYHEDDKSGLIVDSAVFMQVAEGDTLFLHADTLRTDVDSIINDSVNMEYHVIRAFYHVKIFRINMQGMCDSLAYTSVDSVFRLYGAPVIWNEENQITSEYIEIYTGTGRLDSLKMYNNSFIISQEDTVKYNQIKGKNMVGYFRNNEMNLINVYGNGQTIYYPKDGEEFLGVNKSVSTDLSIVREDGQMKKIYFITQPEAVFMPVDEVPKEELILKDFKWLEHLRPKNKNEIFIWGQ